MNVSIITIGDEILIGQIIDTNSAWMGQQLNLAGLKIKAIHSIGDGREDIVDHLAKAQKESDIILITGGLGPTKDDITKKTMADYFGVEMVFHEATWDRIQRMFKRWGRSTTPAHKEQCYMPANAQLLHNKMGTAPGMWFEYEGKVFVSMPGVPYEMKYLMAHEVLPRLREHFPGQPISHRTILTVGEGESKIASRIADFEEGLPANIKLAYLPGLGRVRLRLSGVGNDEQLLHQQLDELKTELIGRIPELIFGFEEEQLEENVGKMLQEKGLMLGTAESCTGGHIAHRITVIPGSSAYFNGSVVAYSNAVKEKVLGVSPTTLQAHGAVSEATVREMVEGALRVLEVDVAVSISGIAGPGGGTPEKPVGTVWMAVGNRERIVTQKLQIGKDRLRNIEYSTVQALNMIRKFLLTDETTLMPESAENRRGK
ncbi:MAG: competence/damage-inducible protein A [Bacteroidota bacterium]